MQLIFEDKSKRVVIDKEQITFSGFSSFHLLVIKVRETKNFVLRIDKKESLNIKPAHELQIIFLITFLQGKNHTLSLEKRQKNNSLTLESFEVFALQPDAVLTLDINSQAEDGDRRPWVTCLLNNLPLRSFTYTLTYSRRKRDSDDVKIVVDNATQGSLLKIIKYKLWRLIGSFLPLLSPTKTEKETITLNLPQQFHLIEFIADRMPALHNLTLDFGAIPIPPTRVPTVDDPAWTGDFYDDSETILLARAIYGEAGGESMEAKIAVGWAMRNRVEDSQQRWGKTYHKVILEPFQYEPFNDPKSDLFKKITHPPLENSIEGQAWQDSFQAASSVVLAKEADPTKRANHFYVPTSQPKPPWADEEKFTVQIGVTRFYRL